MDFELTEKQRILRNTIREFIRKECPDRLVREMDKRHEVPPEIFSKLADLGVCGLMVPQQYEGVGPDLLGALIVSEELAWQWMALSWAYCLVTYFGGANVAELGDESQKQAYLPQIAKGKISFSYALTEPNAGSDLSTCQTMAIPQGDEFIINGQKTYISGADSTNYLFTLVKTDKDLPNRQAFTIFIIDSKTSGIEVRPIEKIGLGGCSSCEVFFNDVHVPKQNIVGGPDSLGKGWGQLLQTLVTERLHLAAEAVGIAQGALDKAMTFAKERTQFGQPIINFQAIGHKLAEMATEVEAARLLTYYAAYLKEQGKPCYTESAMAKFFACDVATRVSEQGLLVAGGHGYMLESEMQRYFRDVMAVVIGGGTPEIQKEAIIRGLRRKS